MWFDQKRPKLPPQYNFWVSLSLILALSVAWRLWNIAGFSGNYDEGAHLMEAWLLSQGYDLYKEIFLPLPPLLVQPLAWLFRLTGPSSIAARLLEIAYAVLGLIAIAGLGRELWSETAGLLAAVVLSISPLYFRLSRFSLGNVPATVLGILSLYGGWLYFEKGRRRWLILAGLIASTSLLIKPLSVAVPFLLAGFVAVRHRNVWRAIKFSRDEKNQKPVTSVNAVPQTQTSHTPLRAAIIDCLMLILALALPFGLALVAYNTSAMWEQVVHFRYQLAQAQTRDVTFNLQHLWYFLSDNAGLSVMALAGLTWLLLTGSGHKRLWFVLAWLSLTLLPILGFESIHPHHFVLLEPIMALLAALAIGKTVHILFRLSKHNQLVVKLVFGFNLIAILFYLTTLPTIISVHLKARPQGLTSAKDQERWQAVQLLQELSSAEQFVLSDDLAIPFEAQRKVPPRLVDPSIAVIEAGYIDHKIAIQVADQQAEAVIFWSGRFREELPFFTWWVENNFAESIFLSPDRAIYFDKQSPLISFPSRIELGDILRFEGYDLAYKPQANKMNLTLYWRKLYWRKVDQTDIDYTVTVRVLDDAGQRLVQVDQQPFQGYFPTSGWPTDVLIWDTITLELTDRSRASKLVIGVYDPDTLQLLTIPNSVDNLIFLPLKGETVTLSAGS